MRPSSPPRLGHRLADQLIDTMAPLPSASSERWNSWTVRLFPDMRANVPRACGDVGGREHFIDVDEILTADETTTAITDVAPAPLSAEARGEMIQRHLEGVPVPFPRNVEIHDRVGATGPTTEADVIETVNAALHEWNLTPDGRLVHNPCPPHARACVDVDNRLAWLQEDGRITAGPVPTTTGMPGYETPRGEFTVQRKVRDEISYVFDNEPMPFSVYFTTTGVAFHEGDLTQDSHGCIHLSHQDAVHFFDVLEPNDIVVTI